MEKKLAKNSILDICEGPKYNFTKYKKFAKQISLGHKFQPPEIFCKKGIL